MRTYFPFLLLLLLIAVACGSTKEIKDGATAYQLKKYALAAQLLQQDYAKSDEAGKAEVAWQIAESYRFINNTQQAARWYKDALQLGIPRDAQFMYARMQMANGEYTSAREALEQILKEEPYRRIEIRGWLKACNDAIIWQQEAPLTTLTPLDDLNTPQADFSLVPFENGQMVWVSSRPKEGEKDQWTGNAYYALYVANRTSKAAFSDPAPFDENLNTPYNNGTVAFNSSFTELIYTQCGTEDMMVNDFCNLYYSRKEPDGSWSEPERLFLFEDSVNIGQPFLSRDGNLLLFAAVEPMGYGGSDLYYSVRTFEGWSPPINLGAQINTPGNEAFPYLDAEGYLYFSSDGLPGIGGFDIFRAAKAEKNRWREPTNIGYPLNSAGDDFGMVIVPLTAAEQEVLYVKGYLSSSRPGGKGLDDLYYFEKAKPAGRIDLQILVQEKVFSTPDNPQSEVTGLSPLYNARVVLQEQPFGTPDTLYTDSTGTILTSVVPETDYQLYASNGPSYFSTSTNTSTRGIAVKAGEEMLVQVEIVLDKIFKEKEIVIPNIYYDFNDWAIREDAAAVLDTTIYKLMMDNPNLQVELGSHTDARGSDEFNMELSQKRAQSVVDYLVNRGISSNRLVAKGYGETQLVNECGNGVECDEEQHQRNRRTTFRVLSATFNATSVEPDRIIVDPSRR